MEVHLDKEGKGPVMNWDGGGGCSVLMLLDIFSTLVPFVCRAGHLPHEGLKRDGETAPKLQFSWLPSVGNGPMAFLVPHHSRDCCSGKRYPRMGRIGCQSYLQMTVSCLSIYILFVLQT